jgi:UPF0755 protein
MKWYHQHFPTFTLHLTSLADWYRRRDLFEKTGINLIAWGGVLLIAFNMLFTAPGGWGTGVYVTIDEGMPLQHMAQLLEERGVISDAWRFKALIKATGNEGNIPAGMYFFNRTDNMLFVAQQLLAGDFKTSIVRITIPEGSTVRDIGNLLALKLPEFDRAKFVEGAKEGYMFPDTYFFRPGQSTEAILGVFENNFRVQMQKIQKEIEASGHTLDELVIMASLLEKEAADTQSRRMIAGILWHRIDIDMPLQVDAVFPYIMGKNTYDVTREELRIDSLYNTYRYKGLPVGPIGNPSLDAILAAATPVKTNYVFYLSDSEGKFHYAKTYAQHMVNRQKYIGS